MVILANPPALLLAASTTSQILNALTDNTFADLYRLQPFDWAILIPYFATLVLLSVYGCHRYEMIRTYYKHRHRMPR
jgi:hypothetical protein